MYSENIVTIEKAGNYELTSEDDEVNAVIFSKDDLIFNGTGTLVINGNYQDGIRGKDSVLFVSGEYQVTAVKDGIQGKDKLGIINNS